MPTNPYFLIILGLVCAIQSQGNQPDSLPTIPVRLVLLGDRNGSLPISLQKVQLQISQLRADAARAGFRLIVGPPQTLFDSANARIDLPSLSRRELESLYPTSRDEIRVYVASLEESDDPSYHLLAPVGGSRYPAIVIDSADVGDSCGPAAEPCRLLSQALGVALAKYAGESPARDAGERMADHARRHANEQFVRIKSVKPILKSAPAPRQGSGNLPYLVKDIHPTNGSVPSFLTPVGDRLFFGAVHPSYGEELWVSDGTGEGTYIVMDTLTGPASGHTGRIRAMGGRAFYQAADGTGDTNLWVADGTQGGASFIIRVADFVYEAMEPLGNLIMFEKEGVPSGSTDLWRTDGTPQGSSHVNNLEVNQMSDASGSNLYMAGSGAGATIPGFDIWKTNGTIQGTVLLADLASVLGPTAFNNGAVFEGEMDEWGEEPWFTNGTPEGTIMLRDIVPGPGYSSPNCFGVFNGYVYFNATAPNVGRETWRTNGTPQGTELFADINPNGSGGGCEFTDVNGTLFFSANHPSFGRELWKSDGTVQGTVLVMDIYPGPDHSGIENLVASSGKLYFSADDGEHGLELWVSDGTEEGTHIISDINPGANQGMSFEAMAEVNGILFFGAVVAAPGNLGPELWALDTRPKPIPTTSAWGMLCFAMVILLMGCIVLRARFRQKEC